MVDALDKFNDWMRAACADSRLTASDKLVLSYIAVFYVRHGEHTFCVKQSTIAERCGISRKAVNSAIGRAKQLGFLAVERYRERGTGRNRADELRLTLPELSNQSTHHSEELHDKRLHHSRDASESLATGSDVTESTELCNQTASSDVTKTPELCNRTNLPSSGNNTTTGLNTGLTTGFGYGSSRTRDDDPVGGDEPIEAEIVNDDPHTADMGRLFNGLFGSQSTASIQPAAAPTQFGCLWCDPLGWRLDHGGRDGDTPKKCDHTTPPEEDPA